MTARRRAIHIDGVTHGPGRPAGSRIDNIIFSAGLKGKDPVLNRASDDPAEQMAELFRTMTRFLEAAGATVDDVIRVDVTLSSKEHRDALNVEWAKYFSDEESLPARKTRFESMPGNFIAEIEVVAVAP